MGVSWSDKAEADLENINPIVRDQIRRNAEVTLPDIQACTGRVRVGNGDIMWHRGITHEQEGEAEWLWEEDDDGAQAWDYYLFYRRRNPTEFEVLGVRSTRQMASWMLGTGEPPEPPDDVSHTEPDVGDQQRPRYPRQVRGVGPYPASGPV